MVYFRIGQDETGTQLAEYCVGGDNFMPLQTFKEIPGRTALQFWPDEDMWIQYEVKEDFTMGRIEIFSFGGEE